MSADSGMGHFRVPLEIANLQGQGFQRVEALVDTGSTYTWIPEDILEQLGVRRQEERTFVLADGSHVQYGMGWMRARIEGRSQPTIVVFGKPNSEPLLGVVTLELFGLGVDPVNQRLIPVPGLLKVAV